MSNDKSKFVVSADWVEKQIGAPEFRIVDASWYLPAQNRSGVAEYAAGHIPGAVLFDQDVIADHTSGLPHTIPSPEFFATEVGKLGIADTDTIVVHDGPGHVHRAARLVAVPHDGRQERLRGRWTAASMAGRRKGGR
ncbi:MAG: rhodanese-like domain-containing protein [Thermomicrobiales bacterium]